MPDEKISSWKQTAKKRRKDVGCGCTGCTLGNKDFPLFALVVEWALSGILLVVAFRGQSVVTDSKEVVVADGAQTGNGAQRVIVVWR